MDQTEIICDQINKAIKSLTDLKNTIMSGGLVVPKQSVEPVLAQQSVEAEIVNNSQNSNDFESLKSILLSDKWPHAVNPILICDPNSESDKRERGIGIIELIIEDPIKGKKFLDFGCGEGHCAASAVSITDCSFSVGYDIKEQKWPSIANTVFTTSYDVVKENGPYDAILLFDVLDHATGESPKEILQKALEVLAPEGKIYMRCHPWISRHGTHLYHKLNKAYAHLVFTEEELNSLTDYIPEPNICVTHPIITYTDIIKDVGLKILSDRKVNEKVDPFFKVPKIADRIFKNTISKCKKGKEFKDFPEFQMGIQFIDYVLAK